LPRLPATGGSREYLQRLAGSGDRLESEPITGRLEEGKPMLMIEDDMLAARVRVTMGELLQSAEQLRGLAEMLDGYCGLSGRAEAEEIKQVAIGIRATAVHALLTASAAVGLSERLSTVAIVLDRVQEPADAADEESADEDET
jgi:hypothetical protein